MWRRLEGFVQAAKPILSRHPRLVLATLVSGLLSSLAEGVGISLFIPLLGGLTGAASGEGGRLVRWLDAFVHFIPPAQRMTFIVGCIVLSVVLRSALQYCTSVLFATIEARVGEQLRADVYRELFAVDYGYWEREASETLFSTLHTESWRVSDAVQVLLRLVIGLCTLLLYVGVLLLISWSTTLVVTVVMLGFSALTAWLTRRAQAAGRLTTRLNALLAKRMLESYSGMKVIRSFGRDAYEFARFDLASRRVSRQLRRTRLMDVLIGPLLELCSGVFVIVLLYVAFSTQKNIPATLVFLLVMHRLQPRVREVNQVLVALDTQRGAVERVMQVLDPAGKPYTHSGSDACPPLRTALTFDQVDYRYEGREAPALAGFSCAFRSGTTTAIVGPSGAGKSTLLKLLLRLYEPNSGTIRWDGVPIGCFDVVALRRRIAVVSQEPFLFDASIRYNIAYGMDKVDEGSLVEAAKNAGAHEFIQGLPQGYATRVGADGVRLSGGQKQRLTLARALLVRPDVLILDEATNALDSVAEEVVQAALRALQGRCTIVVVAHRLSTVRHADNVLVLDAGQLRESGTVQELLRQPGLFAELYRIQFGYSSDNSRVAPE